MERWWCGDDGDGWLMVAWLRWWTSKRFDLKFGWRGQWTPKKFHLIQERILSDWEVGTIVTWWFWAMYELQLIRFSLAMFIQEGAILSHLIIYFRFLGRLKMKNGKDCFGLWILCRSWLIFVDRISMTLLCENSLQTILCTQHWSCAHLSGRWQFFRSHWRQPRLDRQHPE